MGSLFVLIPKILGALTIEKNEEGKISLESVGRTMKTISAMLIGTDMMFAVNEAGESGQDVAEGLGGAIANADWMSAAGIVLGLLSFAVTGKGSRDHKERIQKAVEEGQADQAEVDKKQLEVAKVNSESLSEIATLGDEVETYRQENDDLRDKLSNFEKKREEAARATEIEELRQAAERREKEVEQLKIQLGKVLNDQGVKMDPPALPPRGGDIDGL